MFVQGYYGPEPPVDYGDISPHFSTSDVESVSMYCSSLLMSGFNYFGFQSLYGGEMLGVKNFFIPT